MERIMQGDNRELLKEIEDESVDLIISSPPYWSLKDYGGGEKDIGRNQSLDDFNDEMEQVYSQCYRVLKPGRHACIVIRDITKQRVCYPLHCHTIKSMEKTGFILEDIKYVLLLAHAHYDFVLIFRKGEPLKPWKMTDKFDEPFWDMRKRTGKKFNHPAAFIEEIPKVLIDKYSERGEIVLDMFGGTGTTMVVASKMDRDSIYMELNPEYVNIAKKRLSEYVGLNKFISEDNDEEERNASVQSDIAAHPE